MGAAVTASLTATAGCLSSADSEGADPPAYTDWMHAGGLEDEFAFGYLDWRELQEFEEFDDGEREDELEDELETEPDGVEGDPMFEIPMGGVLMMTIGAGFRLEKVGLNALLATEVETDENRFDSRIDDVLLIDDVYVLRGDLEPDELDDALTAEPDMFSQQYETVETHGAYELYLPVDGEVLDPAIASDDDGVPLVTSEELNPAVALSEDALLLVANTEPLETLRTSIDTIAGDGDRATDENDGFAWLTATAKDGLMVFGTYGFSPDDGYDGPVITDGAAEEWHSLDSAAGVVASLSFDGDSETATADFAAIISDPDEDALEDLLGASADDRSIDVDGDRVSVSATWKDA